MLRALAFASTLTLCSLSHAQPTDPAEAAYQEGKKLYDVQDWDGAIAKFREAYRIRGDQPSLFNIAQAFRLKGDCTGAITAYKTYKRNFPTADNIPKVDKFIADLEANCKAGTPPTGTGTGTTPPTGTGTPPPTGTGTPPPTGTDTTPPTGTTTATGVPLEGGQGPATGVIGTATAASASGTGAITATTGPVDDPHPGKTKVLVGYGLVGVGVIGVVTGAVFAGAARSKANDVSNGSGTWDPEVEVAGERAQRNARIGFAIGGLAAAAGVTLVILGRKQNAEAARGAQLAVAPSVDGAQLVWSGRW